MRKRSAWTALLLILALMLYGCGAGGGSRKESSIGSMTDRGAGNAAPAEAPATEPAADEMGITISDSAGDAVASVSAPAVDRKIIQNAQLEVKVKEADAAIAAIGQAVRASGGYVQENRVEGTRESGRRVAMTVRVPAGSYGSILDLVAGLGEQINRREWTNDVTEEYLDLDARIATGEAHLAQLNKLYEKSGTVTEMIELEREIARVTADLESLKGRFNFLSNQVAFSTIEVTLFEPGVPTPLQDPQTLGERLRNGFLFSWNATIDLAEDLLVGLVSLLPRLLFLAVVVGIVWGVVWLVVRTRRGRRGGGGGAGGTDSAGGTGSAA